MAPILYKCQQFDKRDNEEGQSLDEDECDGDGNRYIFLPFIVLSLPPQKELNRLSGLGKGTKSLTHLVCILKNC